jgi:hypothetical protein
LCERTLFPLNASTLKILFDWVYLVSLAAWVGGALLALFVIGPSLNLLRGTDLGSRVLRALWPRYCLLGAVAASVALPALVAVPLCYPEMRGPWVGVQALLIIAAALIMLFLSNSLTPALLASEAQFGRTLQRGALLNGVVLAIGLGLLLAFAARPAPTGSGIVEPTPSERARREAQ